MSQDIEDGDREPIIDAKDTDKVWQLHIENADVRLQPGDTQEGARSGFKVPQGTLMSNVVFADLFGAKVDVYARADGGTATVHGAMWFEFADGGFG